MATMIAERDSFGVGVLNGLLYAVICEEEKAPCQCGKVRIFHFALFLDRRI